MGEQKLFFEDVSEGDAGPEVRHELTRTDLVRSVFLHGAAAALGEPAP